jgi:hypothetical protein
MPAVVSSNAGQAADAVYDAVPMPSAAHEVPLQLLHERPALLVALLDKLGPGPPVGALELVDTNLRFADPAEVRPDLVFRAERPRWLLLELQNRIDPDKGRRWLMAAALQLNETGAMGEVVVLTSSRRVARWAKKVARVQGDFGSRLGLTPVVLPIVGEAIDALLDEAQPELAFFAAWAVRGRRGPEARRVVGRAVELTERLPEALRDTAVRAIVAVLREPLLGYLREIAMNPDQLPETRAARRFRKFFEEQGKAEGKREGKAEGKREGKAEGKREALLKILAARGLSPSAEEGTAIAACSDEATLDQWIVRATSATSVAEVLNAPRAAG